MSLFHPPHQTIIHNDTAQLSLAVANRIQALATEAIGKHGRFNMALAGGNTPKQLYQCLAREPFCQSINWRYIHFFFGDERGVPHTHPDSNYHMAKNALLDQVDIPDENVHPLPIEHQDQAIAAHEDLLRRELPCTNGIPQFDLILLGLGTDGHIASLFPDTPALHERQRLVLGYHVDSARGWRITLTFPVLEQAQHILLLVAGNGKQKIIQQLTQINQNHHPLPVQQLAASHPLEWHLDQAAAAALKTENTQ